MKWLDDDYNDDNDDDDERGGGRIPNLCQMYLKIKEYIFQNNLTFCKSKQGSLSSCIWF